MKSIRIPMSLLLLSLMVSHNASAIPTVFVRTDGNDATCNGSLDIAAGAGACAKATISAAVATVDAGGTINVAAGIYVDAAQVLIDKVVSIVGAGMNSTILTPGFNTGNSGDSRGWYLVSPTGALIASMLTFDGQSGTRQVLQALRITGGADFSNVRFRNIKFDQHQGFAIVAFGNSMVDVQDSEFLNIQRVGVLYFGPGVNNSRFHRNTYTGKGVGDFLEYGLEISSGAQISVSDNSFSACRGVLSGSGSESAGVLVTTAFGAGTVGWFSGNVFTDNSNGLLIGADPSDSAEASIDGDIFDLNDRGLWSQSDGGLWLVNSCITQQSEIGVQLDAPDLAVTVISNNNFVDNLTAGLTSATNSTVDATMNWWGKADGATGHGGSGDAATGNVDATMPLASPSQSTPQCAGIPTHQADLPIPTLNLWGLALLIIAIITTRFRRRREYR